jgi:carbonic anhydrase/acetyltransferase-like protein (isoleucine patch superfamily)
MPNMDPPFPPPAYSFQMALIIIDVSIFQTVYLLWMVTFQADNTLFFSGNRRGRDNPAVV